jgi:hypothetical protein
MRKPGYKFAAMVRRTLNLRKGYKAVLLECLKLSRTGGTGGTLSNTVVEVSENIPGKPYLLAEKLTVFLVRWKVSLLSLLSYLTLRSAFFNLRRLFSKGKIFQGLCSVLHPRILGTKNTPCHNRVRDLARVLLSVLTLKVSARSITVLERSYQHMPGCTRLVGGATVWCSLKHIGCVCTVGLGLSLLLLLWLTTSDHTLVAMMCFGIPPTTNHYASHVMTLSLLVRHKSGSVARATIEGRPCNHMLKVRSARSVPTTVEGLPLMVCIDGVQWE